MLLGLSYQLIRFIADLVLVRTRSDAQLRAEVLVLRHQLRVDLRATRSEMTGRGLTADHQPDGPNTRLRLNRPIFVQTSRRRTSDCSKRDRLRPQVLRQAVVDPGRALTQRLLARLLLPAADPSFECHGPARRINAPHGLSPWRRWPACPSSPAALPQRWLASSKRRLPRRAIRLISGRRVSVSSRWVIRVPGPLESGPFLMDQLPIEPILSMLCVHASAPSPGPTHSRMPLG